MKTNIILGLTALSIVSLINPAQAQQVKTDAPIPGTVETKSEVLFTLPENNTEVAQRDVELGRLARHDYGYVGGGVNLGFNGSEATPIGDIGFSLNSKIALTRNISVRPNFIFGTESAFLFPVTYDFTLRDDPYKASNFVPYAGGGLAISTDDNNSFGAVLTGGLDYRLSKRFVLNAGLNVGLMPKRTDFGLGLNFGYILTGY